MRIGELARAAGVGVETVRFYEREKLIEQPPRPADGGYRDYSPEDARRIRFVRRAQGLGFSLKEIREFLTLRTDPGSDCHDIRERAAAKRFEVDAKIRRLQDIGKALDELIAACPGKGDVELCSIIAAMERGKPRTNGG